MTRSIYVADGKSGQVKVGFSSNPSARLSGLRKLGKGIDFAFVGECEASAAAMIEARAHYLLSQSRTRGEWFSVSAAEAVAAVMKAAADLGLELRSVECPSKRPRGRPPLPEGTVREIVLSGRASKELVERVDQWAEANGKSRSDAVIALVERGLKRRGK